MLYYLAQFMMQYVDAFNVLTYNTVRAGGAALTGFVISLLIGPAVIRWLRMLKIGQYIREDHVADLHALHKSKAGTPTMGGTLIILSTVFTLVLWGRFSNRLLLIALSVLCVLGALGFLDDYMKIRKKHNLGLTAKAKALGQILVGLALGFYLVYAPITKSASELAERDILDWRKLICTMQEQGKAETPSVGRVFWQSLSEETRKRVAESPWEFAWHQGERDELRHALNDVLRTPRAFTPESLAGIKLTDETKGLLAKAPDALGAEEAARLNRLLLEATFPDCVMRAVPDLHTKIEVPGLRWVMIPMGLMYAFFVMLIIFSSSNAVNLTDGLDGLAIGASIMSLLAYTAISYVVSRADWSQYLYLVYVPEATELTVFGAAMLGTGLGFLWFNSHPAEVFMGDTGSLALGGAIGTMAILTKQELLLIVVGGLFVVEAMSVVIQVVSFKLRGKRVFKMAPIHHHFELLGWSETKVTVRFWIIALLFALMSMGALKLR